MKVAITHDYLIDYGGAERVLLALHEIYPQAPIFVTIVDKRGMGKFWEDFENADIKTSWFNNLPYASKLISPLRFLLPLIWKSFDLSKYDLIIDSSSWAITKGFKTKKNQIEISYCHTPPRYLYGYDTSRNWKGKWFGKLVDFYALIVNHFMRLYDFDQAQKVDYFIANSQEVAKRIQKFYRKNSTIIYPPVDLHPAKVNDWLPPAHKGVNFRDANVDTKEKYYLTGGRFVAAKNFDLIIKAVQIAGVNLKIFGSGILEEELKKISDNNIEFLGKVPDGQLFELYKNARAFIVAQKDEDFGMTVVEAQSAACPVIAYKGGGYLETVVDGKTGIFFEELTVESLVKAINKFKKSKINPKDCINNARKFSKEGFKKEIKKFVNSKLKIKN